MREAFGITKISDEELAAPKLSIHTKPETVKCNANHLAVNHVVSHTTCHVGMMMLDCDLRRDVFKQQSEFCREVLGMKIVGNHLRLNVEQLFVVFDAVSKRAQRLDVFKVADVMTDERAVSACKTKRVLQLSSTRQQVALKLERRANRRGRITARSTHHHLALVKAAHNRIVRANVYRSIVNQKVIGDRVEAIVGFVIAKTDRLV